MKKNKAFTLIELIAVLVILAVIALIVTPLVLNIIRKVRLSADKRSIDAYGRSIEIAISAYLLDTGNFPTNVSQLTVEYSGNEVVCSTTQINSDLTVYLTRCRVAGRDVDYTYGSDKSPSYTVYNVRDEVNYNNVDYYVIENSGVKKSTVTLLKAEPLTVAEVNLYGEDHINRYTSGSLGTANDRNSYGGISYYTSETCRYINNSWITTGCTANYDESEVKYVIDAWADNATNLSDLAEDKTGYKVRLLTNEELFDNLGYERWNQDTSMGNLTQDTPNWLYNSNYSYWTMSIVQDDYTRVWIVYNSGDMGSMSIYNYDSYNNVVRPVIVLKKSALN